MPWPERYALGLAFLHGGFWFLVLGPLAGGLTPFGAETVWQFSLWTFVIFEILFRTCWLMVGGGRR